MTRFIKVTQEVREALIRKFGVSGMTVSRALFYARRGGHSPLAGEIRQAALALGGREMVVEDMLTMHDADGYMRQYFNNGAHLECSKIDGHVDVLFEGETVRTYRDVRMSQLADIQRYAMGLGS